MEDSIVGNTTLYQREFEASSAIRTFHDLGRFGKERNFTLLFSEDKGEQETYTRGLIVAVILTLLFFETWFLYLLLLKCLGPNFSQSWLAGYPFEYKGRVSFWGRVIFLVSSVIVLAFSVLLIFKGGQELNATVQEIDSSAVGLDDLLRNILDNLGAIDAVSVAALATRDALVAILNSDVCPNNGGLPPLPPGIPADDADFDTNQKVFEVLDGVDESTIAALDSVSSEVLSQIAEAKLGLEELAGYFEDITEVTNDADNTGTIFFYALIPVFFSVLVLNGALLMGWGEKYNASFYKFIENFVLPLFVLCILLASIVASLLIFTLQVNSDFCSGGATETPEGSIAEVLNQVEIDELAFNTTLFYSNQCRIAEASPFGFIENLLSELTTTTTSLDELLSSLQSGTQDGIPADCSFDPTVIEAAAASLPSDLRNLTASIEGAIENLGCPTLVPIYTSLFYDVGCEQSASFQVWMFSCNFVIAFFGLAMITVRAAYYPIDAYWSMLEEETLL